MADFTGFPDESSSNLQVSLNSSTEKLSTILDAEFYELDNILSSQENSQSESTDVFDDQEEVESKYNPRLSFEASRAEKQIPAGAVKKSQALFESKLGESKLVSTPVLGPNTRRAVSQGATSPLRTLQLPRHSRKKAEKMS